MREFTSRLLQVNPYEPSSFRERVRSEGLFGSMPAHIMPIWSRCGRYDPDFHDGITPRWQQMTGCFSMASLYYVDAMMRGYPRKVADIGCGENVFKMFYPQITGYDTCNSLADVQAEFNDGFANDHHREFDAAMACNSIHFVRLEEFEHQIMLLASIVRAGGTCHVTANLQRFMDRMDDDDLAGMNPTHLPGQVSTDDRIAVALRLDGIVRGMDVEWLVVDQCYDPSQDGDYQFDNPIVGNMRLVFRVG